MKFQLVARVVDEELFRKSMHELGTVFYCVTNEEKGEFRIVYFSGSRVVQYDGKPSAGLMKLVEATGHLVDSIEVDEFSGLVKIKQLAKEGS